MYARILFFLVVLFTIPVRAGEYFVRLSSAGIQSREILLNPDKLPNIVPGIKKPVDNLEFKQIVRNTRFVSTFNSWLKVNINAEDEVSVLNEFTDNGLIEYYEPIGVFRINQSHLDSLIDEQWYLETINAMQTWEITRGNTDIIIGVIDTGIDYKHPDLAGSLWKNETELFGVDGLDDDNNGFVDDSIGWDFTDAPRFADGGDYKDPDNDPMDEYSSGHGTQIAGIISAAANNGMGIAGIGPELRVMNLRAGTASGYLEEDDVANALLYALDNSARVVNMSFGDVALSRFLKDVIYFVYQEGMIIVASSGNSGNDEVHYPSGLAETISVGASNRDDNLAGFSNYGPTIDCVAPGTDMISTAVGGKYNMVNGTSFSAPVVSAVAGLILSLNPDYGPERIRHILKTSSEDILDFGWDNYSGAGRVSALNAVQVPDGGILKLIQPEPNSSTADYEIAVIGGYISKQTVPE